MTFTVSSSALLKALNLVHVAISTAPIFPILETYHFQLNDGTLTITASDMQITIITSLDVAADSNVVICIPARLFYDTIKNLPEQPLTINLDEDTFTTEILSESGRYKIASQNAIDYPQKKTVTGTESIVMPSKVLSKAIKSTAFCVTPDENKPALGGVLFEITETGTTFVGTDGHRLVRFRRTDIASTSLMSIIMPKRPLTMIDKIIADRDEDLTITYDSQNAYIEVANVKIITTLIAERYVDYQAAIPASNPFAMTVSRQELINSVKRVDAYSNKTTHQIRLRISAEQVEISAEDQDFNNEGTEKLDCQYDGEPMEIGFNAKFLMEMLSNLNASLIQMELTAPNRQGILVPRVQEDNEDILMLVMPVMLNRG